MFDRHFEYAAPVAATVRALFAHLDDHARLAGHMRRSSWMMVGGRMAVDVDALGGRAIGSTIRIEGRALGLRLFAEEVVTEYEPPHFKSWETAGEVRLLVIGPYRMGFEITPHGAWSRLRVFIDYTLPARGVGRWLGRVLGPWYARWCTRRMVVDAVRAFARDGASDRVGRTALDQAPGPTTQPH